MLQVTTGDEHQVVVADDLAGVAHDTPAACRILHEVELHHLVGVDRIVHLLLVAVSHIHKIVFAKWRYLA
jgi:hypothetical protein